MKSPAVAALLDLQVKHLFEPVSFIAICQSLDRYGPYAVVRYETSTLLELAGHLAWHAHQTLDQYLAGDADLDDLIFVLNALENARRGHWRLHDPLHNSAATVAFRPPQGD